MKSSELNAKCKMQNAKVKMKCGGLAAQALSSDRSSF
jgi:hypothetical protein